MRITQSPWRLQMWNTMVTTVHTLALFGFHWTGKWRWIIHNSNPDCWYFHKSKLFLVTYKVKHRRTFRCLEKKSSFYLEEYDIAVVKSTNSESGLLWFRYQLLILLSWAGYFTCLCLILLFIKMWIMIVVPRVVGGAVSYTVWSL